MGLFNQFNRQDLQSRNSGNLIALLLLIAGAIIVLLIYKLPENEISPLITSVVEIFNSERFYIIPFSFVLTISISGNVIQHIIYKKEINRLTGVRKELIHGYQNNELNQLPEHTSSNYELE